MNCTILLFRVNYKLALTEMHFMYSACKTLKAITTFSASDRSLDIKKEFDSMKGKLFWQVMSR